MEPPHALEASAAGNAGVATFWGKSDQTTLVCASRRVGQASLRLGA
jgi:hypothetical protein